MIIFILLSMILFLPFLILFMILFLPFLILIMILPMIQSVRWGWN